MNLLNRLKISLKVFGGFAVILVLLLAVSVVSVLSLNMADETFQQYRALALQSNEASRVQANMLEARLAVFGFQVAPTNAQSERVFERLDAALKLNSSLADIIDEPEEIAMLEEAGQDISDYRNAFEQLVATDDPGQRGEIKRTTLDVIGPRVARDLEKLKLAMKAEQDKLGPQATEEIQFATLLTEIIAGISVIFGLVAAWAIGMGISRPIISITHAMRALADGDKTVGIPGQDHRDEIRDMSDAVLVFKENMIKAEELSAQELVAQKQREERAKLIENLTNQFDMDVSDVLRTVASAATEMHASATSMTSTAEETSKQSTIVAAAAEQASNNVQTVASASEELSASISEISHQVTQSSRVANKAVEEAQSTNAQVRGLAEAAQKIGDVVGLISDIAAQTNLLALNATIEAARAGEAGKGFAVVAAEVKNLANATSKATDDITSQISAIQTETDGAVVAIESIGTTIAEISEIASAIASAVEEQGAATDEINRNVQEASAGTSQVTENIHSVNEAASSTGAAAEQVLSASGELTKEAEVLREKVETFLSAVKAA